MHFAVGADADGDEILDVFARKGLRTQIERVPYPTGTVQVTLDAVGVPRKLVEQTKPNVLYEARKTFVK